MGAVRLPKIPVLTIDDSVSAQSNVTGVVDHNTGDVGGDAGFYGVLLLTLATCGPPYSNTAKGVRQPTRGRRLAKSARSRAPQWALGGWHVGWCGACDAAAWALGRRAWHGVCATRHVCSTAATRHWRHIAWR